MTCTAQVVLYDRNGERGPYIKLASEKGRVIADALQWARQIHGNWLYIEVQYYNQFDEPHGLRIRVFLNGQ